MKVLYIGNYLDGTGWGNASASNILAMHQAGIDVVPRRISYGSSIVPNPEIEALEKKSAKGCEVSIQHCLPKDYYKDQSLKCIGIYHTENVNFAHSLWQRHINFMDEAWVSSFTRKISSKRSGVDIPLKVFRMSIDFSEIDSVIQKPTAQIKELKNSYNFCFFGEFNHRKNLVALMKAFHLEFNPNENVNLFFKISGGESEETLKQLYAINDDICKSLKLFHAKKIRGLAGYLRYSDYLSIMSQCHCMVIPSYGEDPCIPAIEAQGFGMQIVFTDNAGMNDYCLKQYPVLSNIVPCQTFGDTLAELYTGRDTWSEITIDMLRSKMRKAYNEYQYQQFSKEKTMEKIRQFASREAAGKIFKELLCQSTNT